MKRLVWMMTASLMYLVPAAAAAGSYFTWYNSADEERGSVYAGESAYFVVPVVDGVPALPTGYSVTTESWWRTGPDSDPGSCDVSIETYNAYSASVYFSQAGDYEICLKMFGSTEGDVLWDVQTLTVLPEPNKPPSIKALEFSPNPAVAGSPLELLSAQVYDEDGVESCAFDFGEGEEPVWVPGTLEPTKWDPSSSFICTGPAYIYAAAGTYQITVQATDTLGAVGTSTPKSITVVPHPYVFVQDIWIDSSIPALSVIPSGTASRVIRTGIRWASRTQWNVGFTLEWSPSTSGSPMARATLRPALECQGGGDRPLTSSTGVSRRRRIGP